MSSRSLTPDDYARAPPSAHAARPGARRRDQAHRRLRHGRAAARRSSRPRSSAPSSASSSRRRPPRRSSAASSALFPDGDIRRRRRASRASSDEALRGVGLSGQKVGYLRDLSRAHRRRTAAARRARRAARRGGHRAADRGQGLRPLDGRDVPDVPAASARRAAGRTISASSTAMQRLYRPAQAADAKRILKMGEAWRPYRSVASWYLWQTLEATSTRG